MRGLSVHAACCLLSETISTTQQLLRGALLNSCPFAVCPCMAVSHRAQCYWQQHATQCKTSASAAGSGSSLAMTLVLRGS